MSKIIAANWKMNLTQREAITLAKKVYKSRFAKDNEIILCPSFPHLESIAKIIEFTSVKLGAQNCSHHRNGSFTGEVSVPMLTDYNCEYVILGHSERRINNKETSKDIIQKVEIALENGICAIVCVGEPEDVRKEGKQEEYVAEQILSSVPNYALSGSVIIAYEPVWAIGTNTIPSIEEIGKMMLNIKKLFRVKEYRTLYGGSVNTSNIGTLAQIESLDGFLVGGASLNAESFLKMIEICNSVAEL